MPKNTQDPLVAATAQYLTESFARRDYEDIAKMIHSIVVTHGGDEGAEGALHAVAIGLAAIFSNDNHRFDGADKSNFLRICGI
jgi:hypothetical protein